MTCSASPFVGPFMGAALFLAASCASSPQPSTEGLGTVGEFAEVDLTYEASVSTVVWSAEDLEFDVPEDLDQVERYVRVETRTAELTRAEVAALLGSERDHAWSIKTSRDRARRWFDRARETTNQQQQALTLVPGHKSYTSVCNQVAFIESFEVKGSAAELVAEPVISVANEGVVFFATASPSEDGSSVALDAAFERHGLTKPFPTLEVDLPWLVSPAEIQRPVTTHQRVEVLTDLGPDEAVVTAIPRAGDPEHMDVVFLTAKTVDRDGAEVN